MDIRAASLCLVLWNFQRQLSTLVTESLAIYKRTCPQIALGNSHTNQEACILACTDCTAGAPRFLPQSPALLALDCQIVRVWSCPVFSAPYLLPNLRPSAVLLTFCSLVAFGLRLSPAMTLSACFVCRPQRAVLSSSLDASGACPPGQVCTVRSCITCLGTRCLGSHWGLEVPGHPVLGSLHSPSTRRKVSFGWFPLPGLPWIPPLWLMAFAPR